jgi:hypothetical protein
MINWDPKALTALSTEEVEYKEEKSKLYYLKYYIKDLKDLLAFEVACKASDALLVIFGDPSGGDQCISFVVFGENNQMRFASDELAKHRVTRRKRRSRVCDLNDDVGVLDERSHLAEGFGHMARKIMDVLLLLIVHLIKYKNSIELRQKKTALI